ncbi:MAG: hypothetical protein LUI13_06980 [Lachnospiraceae bacterium]|nr:hypothetical protein [Lachnospiraceae bacterium]
MRSLKDYVQEREMRRTGGMPERAEFHSKGYHRYFEGWSEYREADEKGKMRLKRVYTGVYHAAKLSDRQRRIYHAGYAAAWLLSFVLYFLAVTRPLGSNACWYVAAPEALTVACLFWMGWSLFNFLTAGKNMTLGEYRYVDAVIKSSRYTFVAQALTAVGTLAYTFLSSGENLAGELGCTLVLLVCAILCLLVYLLESRVVYDSFLSTEEAPREAQQITYD